jgi:SlyX protein
LEIKASFTEDLVEQLNQVIYQQQQQIDALLREVSQSRQQMPEGGVDSSRFARRVAAALLSYVARQLPFTFHNKETSMKFSQVLLSGALLLSCATSAVLAQIAPHAPGLIATRCKSASMRSVTR